MALLVVAVLGVLGFAIGYAVVGDPAGGVGATALALGFGSISGVASFFGGDKLVLAVSGAKPVDETSAPQLLNVVREMAIAADIPMPAVYVIDDTAPNAFATGPRPEARLDRRHDRAAPEARPRGAAGRHRPRALARPQLRHPLRADRRGAGRRDRAAGRLLPALHVLGWRAVGPRSREGGGGAQASCSSSRSSWRSWRRSSAASSSSRSAASASTWPMPRRSS